MSSLWSPAEDLVGRWDPDARLFIATGWAYGPAGPARVEISPGVILAVDYADPTVTHEITVEAPLTGDPAALDPVTRAAAEALVGPDVLARLCALAAGGDPDRAARISGQGYRTGPAGNQTTARLALLVEMTGDPDLSPLGVAVAGLEAAALATVADADLSVLGGAAQELATVGLAGLMRAIDRDRLTIDEPAFRFELTATLRRVAGVIGDELARRRLQRLVDDLQRGRFGPTPQVASMAAPAGGPLAPSASRPAAAAARKRLAEGAAPPPDLMVEGPDGTRAWRTSDTEVRVSVPAPADGRWARIFRRSDGLLLALAPLTDSSDSSSGHLVVPSGIGPGQLLLDVTHTPEAARPSPDLTAVRNAVASGRRACQFERVGDTASATRIWQVCAAQWAAADDPTRSGIAERYSQGDRFDPRGPRPGRDRRQPTTQAPFLSDRL